MTTLVRRRGIDLVPVLSFGVAALALRDVGTFSFLVPVAAAAGVVLAQPRSATRVGTRRDAATWLLVSVIGASVFAAVRLATPGAPVRATSFALLASVVAAVAEEIVFRRGMYGLLERWGSPIAICVTAVVFGLVHVPMYGWTVLPLDVGAGLVLGWQRWATGTWTAPATTHAVANVLGSI